VNLLAIESDSMDVTLNITDILGGCTALPEFQVYDLFQLDPAHTGAILTEVELWLEDAERKPPFLMNAYRHYTFLLLPCSARPHLCFGPLRPHHRRRLLGARARPVGVRPRPQPLRLHHAH
jgi:hypothetical protein